MEVITLYRPTSPQELELVKQNGYTRWSARLPEQPIFYSVTNGGIRQTNCYPMEY